MEGFKYYGGGRYFAVTNKHPHEYRSLSENGDKPIYIDGQEVVYEDEHSRTYTEPLFLHQYENEEVRDKSPSQGLEKTIKEPYGVEKTDKYVPLEKNFEKNPEPKEDTHSKKIEGPGRVHKEPKSYGEPYKFEDHKEKLRQDMKPKQKPYDRKGYVEKGNMKDPSDDGQWRPYSEPSQEGHGDVNVDGYLSDEDVDGPALLYRTVEKQYPEPRQDEDLMTKLKDFTVQDEQRTHSESDRRLYGDISLEDVDGPPLAYYQKEQQYAEPRQELYGKDRSIKYGESLKRNKEEENGQDHVSHFEERSYEDVDGPPLEYVQGKKQYTEPRFDLHDQNKITRYGEPVMRTNDKKSRTYDNRSVDSHPYSEVIRYYPKHDDDDGDACIVQQREPKSEAYAERNVIGEPIQQQHMKREKQYVDANYKRYDSEERKYGQPQTQYYEEERYQDHPKPMKQDEVYYEQRDMTERKTLDEVMDGQVFEKNEPREKMYRNKADNINARCKIIPRQNHEESHGRGGPGHLKNQENANNLEEYNDKADKNIADEPVMEEVYIEKIQEIESEPLMIAEILSSDQDERTDNDWPPPPSDQIIDGKGDMEEPVQKHKKDLEPQTDLSLYTSFLTIDVSSAKRDGLEPQSLEDSKHRGSLLNLVTGSHELDHVDDIGQIDKEDMDKIRHDLEMISKYLHNMPLGASYWPQNYDVLRDLVKLYLAAKNTNHAALTYLLDYFLKLDWPDIFLKCARKIMTNYPQVFIHSSDRKIPFEDPTPETLDMTEVSLEYAVAVIFQVVLSLAAEFTEVHEESKKKGHERFIQFIFNELLPKLHGIPWGQSTAREEFLHSSMDILYNYVQSSLNTSCFYECNAVEVLVKLRKETDYIGGNRVNIGALLTLSFLIDERNNNLIFVDPAPIGLLIRYIEESLSKIDHCYADFSLSELIDGLTRIAAYDSNKFIICSRGGVSAVSKVLKKTKDNEERIAVCRLLWCLCFVERCKQKIMRSQETIALIRDFQRSENAALQQLAEALIWELEEKYTDLNPAPESDLKHIFISYHPEQREVMLKIGSRLKEKGYKVWLEKSKSKPYSEHLIEAVENAALVIIGVSRKYKQSPSIFSEADYAFNMCKPMLPITVERNFKPDGWLGMLVGSKVWLDFTDTSKFEGHIQMLMRQIGEKGKAERTVNILYIQGHQNKENGLDKMQDRLIDISRWGNEEVIEWLRRNNLSNCVTDDKLKKLRGSHLLRLHHLRRESPEFYYNSLEPQLGFTDVIDMMDFTQALETLTEQE